MFCFAAVFVFLREGRGGEVMEWVFLKGPFGQTSSQASEVRVGSMIHPERKDGKGSEIGL